MDGEVDAILGYIKHSLEVSSQEFSVKSVDLDTCSSWGHIQGQSMERAGLHRLWFCQQVQATKGRTSDKNDHRS